MRIYPLCGWKVKKIVRDFWIHMAMLKWWMRYSNISHSVELRESASTMWSSMNSRCDINTAMTYGDRIHLQIKCEKYDDLYEYRLLRVEEMRTVDIDCYISC